MKKILLAIAVFFSQNSFSQPQIQGSIVDQNGNKIDTIDCAKMNNGDKYYFTVETKENFYKPEYVEITMRNSINKDYSVEGWAQNSFSAAYSESPSVSILIVEKQNDKYLVENSLYNNHGIDKFCSYPKDCNVFVEFSGFSITGYTEEYQNGQVYRRPNYGDKVILGKTKEFTVLTDKVQAQIWIDKANKEEVADEKKFKRKAVFTGGFLVAIAAYFVYAKFIDK